MIEHLFVIFPPGAGGNHLANIISTSPRFATKNSNLDYYNNKTTPTVHSISVGKTLFSEPQLRSIANISSVHSSHFAAYMWCKSQVEQILSNRKYIVMEFSQEHRNNFFLQRVSSLYPAYNDPYLIDEMATWYSIEYFSKITGEQDLTKIDVDLLFTDDSSKMVDYLNSQLGLDLVYKTVDKLHQQWLEKNSYYR